MADELLIMAFERDDPFTMADSDRCFFNTVTHETEWFGEIYNKEAPTSSEWIEVPGTPHSEWHDQFKKWLISIDKLEMYTTSIGLTLKNLSIVDEHYRYDWYDWKRKYAEKKAFDWLEKY